MNQQGIQLLILGLITECLSHIRNVQFFETEEAQTSRICNVFWWDSPPFAYMKQDAINVHGESHLINPNDSATFDGAIMSVLSEVQERCLRHLREPEPNGSEDNQCIWKYTQYRNQLDMLASVSGSTTSKPAFLVPYTRRVLASDISGHVLDDDYWFLPLVESPGAVQFFRRELEPVASDLTNVAGQAWPLVVMILLGAAYSGIIIWLLDRLWNPTNFPKPFIRGFWEGFWWAFVTMTTVGYGDTTPRSIQARIYGLVWIVIGITILSVFTATVTTVLTQSIIAHPIIQGIKVGVLNGSEEYRLALALGAEVIVADHFPELLASMESSLTSAAIVDQYVFSVHQDQLGEDYLIGQMREYPVSHGMLIQGSTPGLRACVAAYLVESRLKNEAKLPSHIQPLKTQTIGALNGNQDLFRQETIIYLFYGSAIWAVLFTGFVIWQFACWRPKHLRRKEMKRNLEEQGNKIDIDGEKKPGVPSNITLFTRPKSALSQAKKMAANTKDNSCENIAHHMTDDKIGQNNKRTSPSRANTWDNTKGIASLVSYLNTGFEWGEHEETKELPRSKVTTHVNEKSISQISTHRFPTQKASYLQALLDKQRMEIQVRELDFMKFRKDWEKTLKETKWRHKREQQDFAQRMKRNGEACSDETNGMVSNVNGALPIESGFA